MLAWFSAYAAGADTFTKCVESRDCRKFVDQVSANFTRELDYAKSIGKIPYAIDGEQGRRLKKLGYLKSTQIIVDGFAKVTEWEGASDLKKPEKAYKHLLLIAQHEQGEVLQGLIYEDPDFQWWLEKQRDALTVSDDMSLNDSIMAT